MSRSGWMIGLDFHMLDARKECVPGFEDSTGGHVPFKTKRKLRVWGPGSWIIDDQYGEEPFDKEKWVEYVASEILKDITYDDNASLKSMVRNLFEQARVHCDENHTDIREHFKKK